MSQSSRQRTIHFRDGAELWHYTVGRCYVRIYRPNRDERAACTVGISELTNSHGLRNALVFPSMVKWYIRSRLRFVEHEIPEMSRHLPLHNKRAIYSYLSGSPHARNPILAHA